MSVLSPLYEGWIEELLQGPLPEETEATCDRCAMVPEVGTARLAFDREIKCCTWLPDLANFLVGRILASGPDLARGRATVEARLDAGVEVTPLGLGIPEHYRRLSGDVATFGTTRSRACPHYLVDRGHCGIWRYSEATCSTWFCRYTRGELGVRFWKTLQGLLRTIERSLSSWCLLQCDVDARVLDALVGPMGRRATRRLDPAEMDGRADAAVARTLWGNYLGHEREFYVTCARLVSDLGWRDVLSIGGVGVAVQARLLQAVYAEYAVQGLPERLRMGTVTVVSASNEGYVCTGYSPYHLLHLSRAIFEVLPAFDGRPVDEVLQALSRERRIRVSSGLLKRLVDFSVLVADRGVSL